MIRRPPGRLGSDPIEPQAREVESLNKGVDRPNRIALIDPVLQTLGKQRRLPAIDPLNEASHLIPPQIAAESYSANQIIQCVFTQRGSNSDPLLKARMSASAKCGHCCVRASAYCSRPDAPCIATREPTGFYNTLRPSDALTVAARKNGALRAGSPRLPSYAGSHPRPLPECYSLRQTSPGLGWNMKRREFIAMLGGAAAWPLAARAQQLSKLPRIGFLQRVQNENVVAFIQALRDAGYVDGQNTIIETRIFETTLDRLPDLAKELVDLKCDVILAASQYAFVAAMKATATIPIVGIDLENDPVASGWVNSLARPGGNFTGLFLDLPELGGKQIELLKEVGPRLSKP